MAMGNKYLKFIFKMVFDHEFNYDLFSDRLLMQKTVYLLQCLGVPIGEYSFSWYKHGPYSQELQDDMYYENGHNRPNDFKISEEYKKTIEELKELFSVDKLNIYASNGEQKYKTEMWVECLASLHFLKTNRFPYSLKNVDEIISEMKKYKPHLCNDKINRFAMTELKSIFKNN